MRSKIIGLIFFSQLKWLNILLLIWCLDHFIVLETNHQIKFLENAKLPKIEKKSWSKLPHFLSKTVEIMTLFILGF